MRPYVLCAGADRTPVLVWANTSKSSWVAGGLQLDRELKVLLTLSAPMSGGEKNITLECQQNTSAYTAKLMEYFLQLHFAIMSKIL